ncbi:MAG: alpha/beta hydrolase [Gemmatimonadaceae bacterium]
MLTALFVLTMSAAGPQATRVDSVTDAPITLKTSTGEIAGTLAIPATPGKHPIVLIIPGSGPTDRDGNSPIAVAPGKILRTDTYKLLAEALGQAGIASVRYDKRGIGASSAAMPDHDESKYRFDTGIDDAAAWIKMLDADTRFSKVIVAGHSEGSLIGMVAAQRAKAEGFISLEGPGRPAADVLREQLTESGAPVAMFGPILDSLSAGKTVDSTPPVLAALFRLSVQPYLISWFRYNPVTELKKLPYATLVVQGTHDVQVTMKDAELLATAPGAKLLTIDGMTHVLKIGPAAAAAQVATVYTDPKVPLPPQLVSAIVAYVRAAPQLR